MLLMETRLTDKILFLDKEGVVLIEALTQGDEGGVFILGSHQGD